MVGSGRPTGDFGACAPRSPSSAPARPECCCPTCSPPRASSRSSSRPAPRSTSPAGSAPASWSSPRSTCCARPAWPSGWTARRDPHRGIYLQWPEQRHHLDFVDLTGRSVFVYGQTEVQKDLVARPDRRRAGGPLRGQRHRDPRPRDRPALGHLHRRRRRSPQRLEADVVVGCDGSFGPSRTTVPGRAAAHVGEDLSLLLAGDPRRRRPVDRRADLRLAPRRLRDALDALGQRQPALPPGPQRHRRRRLVRRPDLGRAGRPGSATARTAGS